MLEELRMCPRSPAARSERRGAGRQTRVEVVVAFSRLSTGFAERPQLPVHSGLYA